LSSRHKDIVLKSHSDHMRRVLKCVDNNQERPDSHYMSKVLSTLRQIVREWSSQGKAERDATFTPVLDVVRQRYPSVSARGSVKIMVPGSGLGRLAFDLAKEGFRVEGNEFSMVMLMTSSFLLNACYEVFLKLICLFSICFNDYRRKMSILFTRTSWIKAPSNFCMIAGDFLEVMLSRTCDFDCVVTAWFIDTAKNIIDYIETIYRILKAGGLWVNVGPLTYHYEDMLDEISIELPYEEVMRIVRLTGFEIEKEERIVTYYTRNHMSMLQNQYTCAFFVAVKPLDG
uniref:carnosine N-methyltransferase n=1 Tax=Angiostrongylus cantonensis TaxID=6313 RepID=A0A0K0DP31_ANGCA